MDRRQFLARSFAAMLAPALSSSLHGAQSRPRRVLLRSSWQTVNIGDIAHTPGVLALLEKYLPGVETTLWPSKVDNGVEEMLCRRFPGLAIIRNPTDLKVAFSDCDFLLHGSGPSLVGGADIARWLKATGKPYGVYGITSSATDAKTVELLNGARFVFFRDSVSCKLAQSKGVKCPIMEFGPDGAFAVDLRNDAAAGAFLKANNLQEGKFLCCLSRLRYTPYWRIRGTPPDKAKHERNEALKEHDHAPLREAIIAVVRQTSLKVLLCPEDQTQMAVGKEMLLDKLPDDVKSRVVWREKYWLTDEALSTYVRSAGVFGSEMHSPIMCVGNGLPAIVCRWAEQTSKGLMWRDIGLGEWLFDMDDERQIPGIVPAVLAMAKDPVAARQKALKAQAHVRQRQRETMAILGGNLDAEKRPGGRGLSPSCAETSPSSEVTPE